MKRSIAIVLIGSLMALILVACGTSVRELQVELPERMAVGDVHLLNVVVLPEKAEDKTLTYTTSDSKVATISENGKITALSAGVVSVGIQSTNKKVSVSQDIEVYIGVETIEAPSEIFVPLGGDTELLATALPKEAEQREVKLISADESIAKVNGLGIVSGISEGETTITASSKNGKTTLIKVHVKTPPEGMRLSNETEQWIAVGETYQLEAFFTPENEEHVSAVEWSSSDEKIATVDSKGLVTAKSNGEAIIYANTPFGLFAGCKIFVGAKPTNTGGSGSSGGGANNTPQGNGGGQSGNGAVDTPAQTPAQSAGLSDSDIQSIVASARSYAQSLGFTVIGGLQPSWSQPTYTDDSFEIVQANVNENVLSVYELEVDHYGEFMPGSTISIEYIVNGPAGIPAIYVSY